ncbi:MAG: phytanoyl-CoA dioxygenase family protein [Alphaproteobacteria bacterium]|jgi:phytanoyl-CoA hydroxylase|nr:phytanoyl-CoA dioxygenase family protein [Alphaproteobacteria bacterium]MBT4084713.1 phytanoyl-CoA dioxygenase family protein [Alphaproteobacteria bacterium]MBT4544669.1 phytanoyl-CoA dioxygenase family protein [Alphaproteobacteria bacterium]MBT7744917.1 phytanoyl-CoA dioxygenase family protein [Alphaproteobacteria bacterium]
MISDDQVEAYHRDGYVVVGDVFNEIEVAALNAVTDNFVQSSREVSEHNQIFDLEDDHSAARPRVRRIKTPHLHHEVYDSAARDKRLVSILDRLIGPGVRFDTGKLNLKEADGGASVEWHQDWAFYPHTNDDLLAVGILLDDVDEENGPLMVVPGSHKGPVFDHHADGAFCGAIDIANVDIGLDKAVPLHGKAGSITIHHCRTTHGSAPNVSARARRLLLFQYIAADAFPLMGISNFEEFSENLLSGETSCVPRLEAVPVRMPLPPAQYQGSIYENQRTVASGWRTNEL